MTIADADLGFEHHLKFYMPTPTSNAGFVEYAHKEAAFTHALSVTDAIRDVFFDTVALSDRFQSNLEAVFHLRFGVGRRAKQIWISIRELIEAIHPTREEPLTTDEGEQAGLDLNVIYINIRGIIDNLSWCLLALRGTERMRALPPAQVYLFNSKFLKEVEVADVARAVIPFESWHRDLKARRDPAAHRIPLYVPPAILNPHHQAERQELEARRAELTQAAIKAGVGDEALRIFEEVYDVDERIQRIGGFWPVFMHHPDEGQVPIYPTVPEDIGQLIKIYRVLSACFEPTD
jgi:hypothetical protein